VRRTLLLVLAGLAFAAGAGAAAPQPSFTSEQLVGTLSDDFWEPTTAADPNSGYVYQAVTAIGSHECTKHNCPGTSIEVRASSDGGSTWGPARLRLRDRLQERGLAVRSTARRRFRRDRLRRVAEHLQPGHGSVEVIRPRPHVDGARDDERRPHLQRQAHARRLPVRQGRVPDVRRQDGRLLRRLARLRRDVLGADPDEHRCVRVPELRRDDHAGRRRVLRADG
jgi:hypothetical protein